MKIIYDRETDTLTLILNDNPVYESDELKDGVIIDYNEFGQVVAVEILDASKTVPDPTAVIYELKEKIA